MSISTHQSYSNKTTNGSTNSNSVPLNNYHSKAINNVNSSRLNTINNHNQNFTPTYTLKHDINFLLNCFNQLDRKNFGQISKQSARILFRQIQVYHYQGQLSSSSTSQKTPQFFQFDHILSILGKIQVPQQPSIYVISFVKILSQFRNKCIQASSLNKQQQNSNLIQANQIDKKIKNIVAKELDRQTKRLEYENKKSFEEMEFNQDRQYRTFQDQWNAYIGEYSTQTRKKVKQTIQHKNKSLQHQQSRFVRTARRYSVLTSTKLTQLEQRKKRLVKQGKYNQAILIKDKIAKQKQRLQLNQQNQTSFVASKRFQSLKKKNDSILRTTIMTTNNNLKKLLTKKKQGEQIMRIRMKSIREQTLKKLNENIKKEVNRLKSLFYEAAKK